MLVLLQNVNITRASSLVYIVLYLVVLRYCAIYVV